MSDSINYAFKTIELIKKNKLEAEPEIYSIVYDYFSGKKQALVSPFEERLKNNEPLTVSFIDDLKQNYYDTSQATSDISNDIVSEMNEITKALGQSITSFEGYEHNVLDSIKELKESKSGSDIAKVIKKLVSHNEKIVSDTRKMEENLLESKNQIEELNTKLTNTTKQAFTDELTKIPNRLHFNQVIEQEIKEAQQTSLPLCLLIGDIDYFKKFNDTYGHQVGDQVLRFVGHVLKHSVKGRDFCARYGGEEFVVLLPETHLNNAVTVGNAIRKSIQQKELRKKSTNESLGTITMSIGVSLYRSGEKIEDFISRADACLYLAKDAGRNNVKTEQDKMKSNKFAS